MPLKAKIIAGICLALIIICALPISAFAIGDFGTITGDSDYDNASLLADRYPDYPHYLCYEYNGYYWIYLFDEANFASFKRGWFDTDSLKFLSDAILLRFRTSIERGIYLRYGLIDKFDTLIFGGSVQSVSKISIDRGCYYTSNSAVIRETMQSNGYTQFFVSSRFHFGDTSYKYYVVYASLIDGNTIYNVGIGKMPMFYHSGDKVIYSGQSVEKFYIYSFSTLSAAEEFLSTGSNTCLIDNLQYFSCALGSNVVEIIYSNHDIVHDDGGAFMSAYYFYCNPLCYDDPVFSGYNPSDYSNKDDLSAVLRGFLSSLLSLETWFGWLPTKYAAALLSLISIAVSAGLVFLAVKLVPLL